MTEIRDWLRGHRTPLTILGLLAALSLALLALHHLTSEIPLKEVRASFHAIGRQEALAALALTIVSYLALTFYDVLALRTIGRPLPWRTAALASFTSYTLSHNLGLSLLTGGSARYRIYTAAGLDGGDVARVIAIASATFWLGVVVTCGAALALHQGAVAIPPVMLSPMMAHGLGAAILLVAAGLVALCDIAPRRASLFGWTIPLPRPTQLLAQIGIATVDLVAAGAALFVLLPGAAPALLPVFVLAYSLGIIVALVSHVPGGIGVFEAVVVAILPGDKPALLAALVVYRVIYYLLPLGCGVALWAIIEGRRWHGPAKRTLSGARRVAGSVAPVALGAASFVGGTILLLSGSLPAIHARLHVLHTFVPLPFIEASHVAASLVGTGLLLIAPGLYRRLDGAFVIARALLIAGALFSLAKGIDYEEATVCFVIAGLLQWTRPAFYRRTALTSQVLSASWVAYVSAVFVLALWIGFFAYKHVAYQDDMWWQFSLHGDAPRFLRASLAAGVLLSCAVIWQLFSAGPVADSGPVDQAALARALSASDRTEAMLALVGDKRFLFSTEADAFIMYQVRGATWVVMADPVGPRDAWPDLLWQIRAMADAAQGRLLLYQISGDMLEMAIELGLHIVKYGEEGIVDLAGFSLDGSQMRALRHADRRAQRDGASFAIVPAAEVPALLPELRVVSDQWLAAKGQKEKGFSIGRFDPDYLAHFDCAVVRQQGRIVAFANIWATADRSELSVDLMRHVDALTPGIMDFLFAHLMLWGRDAGYARFSIGLAPLSGIDGRRLAPNWARVAALVFAHGERFYGFRGLRAYKEKFAPHWEPRYIAGPAGLGLVQAVGELNALIG